MIKIFHPLLYFLTLIFIIYKKHFNFNKSSVLLTDKSQPLLTGSVYKKGTGSAGRESGRETCSLYLRLYSSSVDEEVCQRNAYHQHQDHLDGHKHQVILVNVL